MYLLIEKVDSLKFFFFYPGCETFANSSERIHKPGIFHCFCHSFLVWKNLHKMYILYIVQNTCCRFLLQNTCCRFMLQNTCCLNLQNNTCFRFIHQIICRFTLHSTCYHFFSANLMLILLLLQLCS